MDDKDIAAEILAKAHTLKSFKTTPDDRLKGNRDAIHLELQERTGKGEGSEHGINWDVLKVMRFGVHTKIEFEVLGHMLTFRLLTDGESRTIKEDLLKEGLMPPTCDEFGRSYSNSGGIYESEFAKRTLSIAGTSRPGLKDAILNYESWNMLPLFAIMDTYTEYVAFEGKCNLDINSFDEDTLIELAVQLEKKPLLLNELPYKLLVKISHILLEHLMTLRQLEDNLRTQ